MTKKTKRRKIFEEAVEYFWDEFDSEGYFEVYRLAGKIELFMEQNPHKVSRTGIHAALSGLMAARLKEDGDDWVELNEHGAFLFAVWLAGWRMAIHKFDPEYAHAEDIE